MLLLYDIVYIDEYVMVYIAICDDDYLWYKLYGAKYYLWCPILFTCLCGVMELHICSALIGLGWDHW